MKSGEVGEVFDVSTVVSNGPISRTVINVWIVDNQPVFQQEIATALQRTSDLVLGGFFVHPEDALLCQSDMRPPDVILMDVQQFGPDGITAVRQFRSAFDGVPLIVLTDSIEEEVISNAVCAGASGYLLKDASLEKIAESIRVVVSGGALLAPVVARCVLDMFRRLSGPPQDCGLTVRELKILGLMVRGLVMKEIAEHLAISYHTVDTHSRNIYAKLGVHSRAGAVATALRSRII